MLVSQLVEELAARPRGGRVLVIRVYEKRTSVGPGLAYDTSDTTGLLNTSIETMSAVPGDPLHFARWLAGRGEGNPSPVPGDDRGTFALRARVGHYLQERFAAVRETALAHGLVLEVVHEEVTRLERAAGHWLVETKGEASRPADMVILALGNLPATNYPHLAGHPGYLISPYPTATLPTRVPRTASVAVLGARLSAVDAALALVEQGHEGPIVLASRRGFTPAVRTVLRGHVLRVATVDALDALSGRGARLLEIGEVLPLLVKEIQDAGGGALLGSAPPALDPAGFAVEVARARAGDAPPTHADLLEAVQYALIRDGVLEWLGARTSEAARDALMAVLQGPVSARRRLGIDLPSAEKLSALLSSARLSAIANLSDVQPGNAGLIVTSAGPPRTERAFDVVINATGPSLDIQRSSVPLLQHLLTRGWIRPYRHGGIEVEFASSRVIAADGTVPPELYAIGVATSRVHFSSNLHERNLAYAAAFARMLADELCRAPAA